MIPTKNAWSLHDFMFQLPDDLIAKYPLPNRSDSRLLCIQHQQITHQYFPDILSQLQPHDLLVFNETRVIPARLIGKKATGGKVELLLERVTGDLTCLVQLHVSKSPRVGDSLYFAEQYRLEVMGRRDRFYECQYHPLPNQPATILQLIEDIGQIPLPPYMAREAEESDLSRYQTVYAKHKGSVAAPTAGFHFDDMLFKKFADKKIECGYLTLHIGAGTFLPVKVDDIHSHVMHHEYIEVSPLLCEQIKAAKARGNRVIAVGTTTLRALETASLSGKMTPFSGDTNLFIYPGFQCQTVDVLITNLHLPGSTLLMLVTAFGGYDIVMQAYQEAVQHQYRFYSYGDAMWIEQQKRK